MTGAEDTGTGGQQGLGPDAETASPQRGAAADMPSAPGTWQPHAPPADVRPTTQAEPRPSTFDPVATTAAAPPEVFAAPPPEVYAAPPPEVSSASPAEGAPPSSAVPPAQAPSATAPWGVPGLVGPEAANGSAAHRPDGIGDAAAYGPEGSRTPGYGPPAGAQAFGPPPGAPGWAAPRRHGIFGPPHPPRPPHRWGLGAYFLVEAVFLLVSALLASALAGRLTSSAGAVALALAVPTVCAAALAVLITQIRGNGPRIDLGLTMARRDIMVGVLCGFAGLVVTIPASLLYVAIVGTDATSAVGEAFDHVRAGPLLALTIFVIVVFVAPLCEEIVYRGLLWGAVERLGANRWWALAVTTFVFALAHFEFSRTPLLLVVAIPIGIARVITGRLPAGVIAHQINNLLPGLVLTLGLLGVVPMA